MSALKPTATAVISKRSEDHNDDSVDESNNGSSTNTGAKPGEDSLARKESHNVFRLRVLVILLLILTAAVVSYVVYRLTTHGEEEEFIARYEGVADTVISSFERTILRLGSVASVGVALTSYNEETGGSWPFVTLPNFPQVGLGALRLSGATFIAIAPIVSRENFDRWDNYVNSSSNEWIDESLTFQEKLGDETLGSDEPYKENRLSYEKVDLMHYFDDEGSVVREETPEGPYIPYWQTVPFFKSSNIVNYNLLHEASIKELAAIVIESKNVVFGGIVKTHTGKALHSHISAAAAVDSRAGQNTPQDAKPFVEVYFPVFDSFNETKRDVVAILIATIEWEKYLENILPSSVGKVHVVFDYYECGSEKKKDSADGAGKSEDEAFTFLIDGPNAEFVGYGDLHEGISDLERGGHWTADKVDDGTAQGLEIYPYCNYDVHVYPTNEFHDEIITSTPANITATIACVFIFTIGMFLLYDYLVEKRQYLVLTKAKQSTAVVSSLFPKNVLERLMETRPVEDVAKTWTKGLLNGKDDGNSKDSTTPIADLFLHCTVFFGDISGFTAWSSTREPSEVFTLLQTLYQAFDALANRRNVFKVETIGDCYMACTGVPEPQPKHALLMVRFAWDCLIEMDKLCNLLEVTLGPETTKLGMRIGLHSGPVTAGVLRGERARFQLFGDTVNTAARMESTGIPGRIQVSTSTAEILKCAGKELWLTPRSDTVQAKGKGELQTFWANPSNTKDISQSSGNSASENNTDNSKIASQAPLTLMADERLVEWIVLLFIQDIKKILHAREHSHALQSSDPIVYRSPKDKICLDELKSAIKMPEYNAVIAACNCSHDDISIDDEVVNQLRLFVTEIAMMYRNNPFHNFEHACHVVMSVKKLLKRVTAPKLTQEQLAKLTSSEHTDDLHCHLHEFTYGINSEPLALIAMTFAALIHDVDHKGCSNAQLMVEDPEMVERYRGKSAAEQNSVDVGWEMFMEDRFDRLRRCIFLNQNELKYFRQVVVNIVMATDIFDKDLNALRRERWSEAFSESNAFDSDLRATIVLEHVIQASDVSHTMQHWQIYKKWNRRLFLEMHAAFKAGRLAKDPASFWYKGELGFFDNYVIPLARKLKECGVFGVSSDEYLNYAQQNRNEWEARGMDLLNVMVAELDE